MPEIWPHGFGKMIKVNKTTQFTQYCAFIWVFLFLSHFILSLISHIYYNQCNLVTASLNTMILSPFSTHIIFSICLHSLQHVFTFVTYWDSSGLSDTDYCTLNYFKAFTMVCLTFSGSSKIAFNKSLVPRCAFTHDSFP